MKLPLFSLCLFVTSIFTVTSSLRAWEIIKQTTDYKENPIGIDNLSPRLSWILESDERNQRQSAYRILAASDPDKLQAGQADLWDSGKIDSDQSTNVVYQGKPLNSRQRVYWKVRSWNQDDQSSPWSEYASFEMGLLAPSQWKAKWLMLDPETRNRQAAYFHRKFRIEKPISDARVYVSGLGYYKLFINGQKIGDHELDPGMSDYEQRTFYAAYNVTKALTEGHGAIGLVVGDGWYNQDQVWAEGGLSYGQPRGIVQLEVSHPDGSRTTFISDESWKASTGPILRTNIYAGENHDARKELKNWATPDFNDTDWSEAIVAKAPGGRLVSQDFPAIKKRDSFRPLEINQPKPGVFVYKFPQNMSGWVRLSLEAAAGTRIQLRFAEKTSPDGMIDPSTTGVFATGVVQTDNYICSGMGPETWEPSFTYHGFQYVEMIISDGNLKNGKQPNLDTLTAIEVNTATEDVGSFETSNPLLNQIHAMARHTTRSNAHSLPADSNTRERCGWTGDGFLISEMSCYNFDAATYWQKYVRDIMTGANKEYRALRFGDGFHDRSFVLKPSGIPNMIAPGLRMSGEASPEWGSAMVLIPWTHYLFYNDRQALEEAYPYMAKWIDHINHLTQSSGGIAPYGLGDWCSPSSRLPDGTRNDNWAGNKEVAIFSTIYYIRSLEAMVEVAKTLGRIGESERYANLLEDTRQAYKDKITQNNQLGSQSSYMYTLLYDLHEKTDTTRLESKLASLIEDDFNGHFDAGNLALPYFFETLGKIGRDDLAYSTLTIEDPPSYAAQIRWGATTIWETWTASYELNSRAMNQPAQGGFDAWFFRRVLGIAPTPEKPGFQKVVMKPQLWRQLEWTKGHYHSIHGKIDSHWESTDGTFHWNIRIPPNTQAVVYLPSSNLESVSESNTPIRNAKGVLSIGSTTFDKTEATRIEIGSGSYVFQCEL